VGEKVLVEMGSTGNYLLGYIPNETDNPFAPVQNGTTLTEEQNRLLETGRGMALRYRQTGKKQDKAETEGQYSEIGFYHEQTQWKPKSADDYADVPTEGDTKGFPKIDRINIQSTGDIYESAVNHHQVKAKRMEILVNAKNKNFSEMDVKEDDYLRSGDMHITAGKRIIINAEDEIQLRVGRSSIVISDEKIEIKSKKNHGVKSGSSWDTTIELDPNSGVSVFGQHLEFSAAYGFEIKEAYGGRVSSTSGMFNISGRDIKLENLDTLFFFSKGGLALLDFITNSISIGRGLKDKDEGEAIPYINSSFGFLGDTFESGWGGYLDCKDENDFSWIDLLKSVQDLLLKINSLVLTILSAKCDSSKKRDNICLAGVVSEFGLILEAYIPLCICGGMTGMKNNVKINLAPHAHLSLEASSIFAVTSESNVEASAPFLGAVKAGSTGIKIANAAADGVGGVLSLVEGILEEALGKNKIDGELWEL
jgi:hypothetical protein